MSFEEPGPIIVTFAVISENAETSVIVPLRDERSIVLPLGLPGAQSPPLVSVPAFALLMASRREHLPSVAASSFVVFTVIVAAAYAGLAPVVPIMRATASATNKPSGQVPRRRN